MTANEIRNEAMLAAFRAEAVERFTAVPVIAQLLHVRGSLIYKMNSREIVLQDAYNKPLILGGETDDPRTRMTARRALAQACQSWEQRLMEPVRQLALDTYGTDNQVLCVLYQHDGASLRGKRTGIRFAKQIERLQAEVRAHALTLGIDTHIEVKAPGRCYISPSSPPG